MKIIVFVISVVCVLSLHIQCTGSVDQKNVTVQPFGKSDDGKDIQLYSA